MSAERWARRRQVRTMTVKGCVTRIADWPSQPMEGPLEEEEQVPKLPLKNGGGLMDVEVANAAVISLRRLLDENPHEFQALVALVDGRKVQVSATSIEFLRNHYFLAEDGSPLPVIAKVLHAAYRPDTPDGPCIVDPLDLHGPQDVALVQSVEEAREKRAREGPGQLLREILRKKDDKGPSRP